jgi:hypothetical protein
VIGDRWQRPRQEVIFLGVISVIKVLLHSLPVSGAREKLLMMLTNKSYVWMCGLPYLSLAEATDGSVVPEPVN